LLNPPEADKFLRLPREMRSPFLWGQAQILILKILYVFPRLKISPSLNLNKNEHFSKVSTFWRKTDHCGFSSSGINPAEVGAIPAAFRIEADVFVDNVKWRFLFGRVKDNLNLERRFVEDFQQWLPWAVIFYRQLKLPQ
jgi:hypothetical protein